MSTPLELVSLSTDKEAFITELKTYKRPVLVISTNTLEARKDTYLWLLEGLAHKRLHTVAIDLPIEEKSLLKALDTIQPLDADVFVALGGGAVLDGAKLLSFLSVYSDPERVKDILKGRSLPQNHDLNPPIYTVPTSLKVESCVNTLAYVHDAYERLSYELKHPHLLPHSGVIDLHLIETLPKERGVFQAFDTLATLIDGLMFREDAPFLELAPNLITRLMEAMSRYLEDPKEHDTLRLFMEVGLALGRHQYHDLKTPLMVIQDTFMSLNPNLPIGVAMRALLIPYLKSLQTTHEAPRLERLNRVFHRDVIGLEGEARFLELMSKLKSFVGEFTLTKHTLYTFDISEENISDVTQHLLITHPEFTLFDEERMYALLEQMFTS